MPHPRLGKEAAATACFEDTDTEVDILTEAHFRETSQCLIHFGPYAHIERAWIELVQFLLPSSYASGGKERGHGVADGFLRISKRVVCAVWSAKGVGRFSFQFLFHLFQIGFRQHHIRVEHYQIFSLRPFCTVVTCLPWSGVGFLEIFQVEHIAVFSAHLITGHLRPIFHHYHLKGFQCLPCQALQQFTHLVRTVEHGHYKREFHIILILWHETYALHCRMPVVVANGRVKL